MRAVWSFWTKPFKTHHKRLWLTEKHHYLAWVLSVETARKHYPDTALFTDDEGVRLLVDNLGLNFAYVSTDLNVFQDADPNWWVLGKLWTYRSQKEPFVHIDNDVFLWKGLPLGFESADVFAQNPEFFPFTDESWYRPIEYDRVIRAVSGWAPEEWTWYTSHGGNHAVCCGILGGSAIEFLTHYADLAIRMIQDSRNQAAWASIGTKMSGNILLEQYLLAACLNFHGQRTGSRYNDIGIRYLFNSVDEAFEEAVAARVGYTHLIGGAKSNVRLVQRLEERVKRDYPEYYVRCLRLGRA